MKTWEIALNAIPQSYFNGNIPLTFEYFQVSVDPEYLGAEFEPIEFFNPADISVLKEKFAILFENKKSNKLDKEEIYFDRNHWNDRLTVTEFFSLILNVKNFDLEKFERFIDICKKASLVVVTHDGKTHLPDKSGIFTHLTNMSLV